MSQCGANLIARVKLQSKSTSSYLSQTAQACCNAFITCQLQVQAQNACYSLHSLSLWPSANLARSRSCSHVDEQPALQCLVSAAKLAGYYVKPTRSSLALLCSNKKTAAESMQRYGRWAAWLRTWLLFALLPTTNTPCAQAVAPKFVLPLSQCCLRLLGEAQVDGVVLLH